MRSLNTIFLCNPEKVYPSGFNGQEKDDEIKGVGNSLEFKFRDYDSRIGRFISIDPLYKKYPWYTPFQFAGNTTIQAKDLEGKEPEYVNQGNYFVSGSDHFSNSNPKYQKRVEIYARPSKEKPLFSKNSVEGISAFGVQLEGPQGKGGLMGEGDADPSLKGGLSKNDAYGALDAVSTLLKSTGTIINITGNLEAGIPIYQIGDKISTISEGSKIVEDFSYGNNDAAYLRIGSLGISQVGGNFIGKIPNLKNSKKQLLNSVIDLTVDKKKEEIMKNMNSNNK